MKRGTLANQNYWKNAMSNDNLPPGSDAGQEIPARFICEHCGTEHDFTHNAGDCCDEEDCPGVLRELTPAEYYPEPPMD